MSINVMEYKLENPKNFREEKYPILYGRCEESHNIKDKLWFITISTMFWRRNNFVEWNESFPYEDHTFLVEQCYATPFYMNQFRADVFKWSAIANKIFIGEWCARYEQLWKDVPVYISQEYPDIKIGYCRTQSTKHPDRELWFVSLKSGSTFVVDKVCTTDKFLKRMGRDINKWMSICWCHLQHEVVWEDLQTGTLDGGYVRNAHFSLDSPYIPSSIENIEERITKYELQSK